MPALCGWTQIRIGIPLRSQRSGLNLRDLKAGVGFVSRVRANLLKEDKTDLVQALGGLIAPSAGTLDIMREITTTLWLPEKKNR